MEIAYALRPHHAETVCGDTVAVARSDDALLVAVIDGLGHGAEANKAAVAAREEILANAALAPAELIRRCHRALQGTRGAAVGVLRLMQSGAAVFAGVGNVAVIAKSRQPIRPISLAGIVGQRMRKVQEFAFETQRADLLCIHSDGLSSSAHLDGVERWDLQGSARRLVEQFGAAHDDVTAVLIEV